MKKCLALLSCLAALSSTGFAQTTLTLLDSATGLPTGATTIGVPFTLDIDVSSASTISIDSFEITLVPETTGGTRTNSLGTATFALGTAVTSTFKESGQTGDTYGALADSTADDLTVSPTHSPEEILTATFTPTAAGTYDIFFGATGSSENLYTSSGTPIASTPTPTGAVITVATVPEPSATSLLLLGMAGLLLPRFWKRFAVIR